MVYEISVYHKITVSYLTGHSLSWTQDGNWWMIYAMSCMRGAVMVMVVRLTTTFPTQNRMSFIDGNKIMRGVAVRVLHFHHVCHHKHQNIPNPVMKVSNKAAHSPANSMLQCFIVKGCSWILS